MHENMMYTYVSKLKLQLITNLQLISFSYRFYLHILGIEIGP